MFSFFIEHILGHLPYWIWPFFVGVGIAAYFILGIASIVASLAPQYKPFVSYARAICILVVFGSVFMFGAEGTINVYKAEHIKDAAVVAVGEQASKDTNAQIKNDLVDKQGDVKTNTVYVTKYIHDNAGAINTGCDKIDDAAFDAYNQAVTNNQQETVGEKK
jgi:hypothetical protein